MHTHDNLHYSILIIFVVHGQENALCRQLSAPRFLTGAQWKLRAILAGPGRALHAFLAAAQSVGSKVSKLALLTDDHY